jgi:hypothetical protein
VLAAAMGLRRLRGERAAKQQENEKGEPHHGILANAARDAFPLTAASAAVGALPETGSSAAAKRCASLFRRSRHQETRYRATFLDTISNSGIKKRYCSKSSTDQNQA